MKITIAGISTMAALLCGCGNEDTRIDNIEDYYIYRIYNENGTEADIARMNDKLAICPANSTIIAGHLKFYSENYTEESIYSEWHCNFSPIQFILYTDLIEKETYYKNNTENTDNNKSYISKLLETYEFKTHVTYVFRETTYEYVAQVYKIENKLTDETRYVIGYPLIEGETNPTQIYDALTAGFIYLDTNEFATPISSELDEKDGFTLKEGHTILENIAEFENNSIKRNQNLTNNK